MAKRRYNNIYCPWRVGTSERRCLAFQNLQHTFSQDQKFTMTAMKYEITILFRGFLIFSDTTKPFFSSQMQKAGPDRDSNSRPRRVTLIQTGPPELRMLPLHHLVSQSGLEFKISTMYVLKFHRSFHDCFWMLPQGINISDYI
jgi:hypothetical protein